MLKQTATFREGGGGGLSFLLELELLAVLTLLALFGLVMFVLLASLC